MRAEDAGESEDRENERMETSSIFSMATPPSLKKQNVVEIAVNAANNKDMMNVTEHIEIQGAEDLDIENTKNGEKNENGKTGKDGKDGKDNTKSNLFEKFRRLGITGSAEDFFDMKEEKEDENDPLNFQKLTDELVNRQDIQAYTAYERCYKVILGVNSIDILSGNIRFNIAFEGCEIMDLLPEPISIQKVKDECSVRKNKKIKTQM